MDTEQAAEFALKLAMACALTLESMGRLTLDENLGSRADLARWVGIDEEAAQRLGNAQWTRFIGHHPELDHDA